MWQIDSSKITNYNPSKGELEALIIFWVLAAGKTAKSAEKILFKLIPFKKNPFEQLKKYSEKKLALKLQSLGCGCFNNKAKTIYQLINSDLNLFSCLVEDLESIYGIGRKTSRGFVLHTRKNAQCAVLDTHILKFLKEQNAPNVPKSTPSSKSEYERLEKYFLSICRKKGKSPAKLDLEVWNLYSKINHQK